MFHAIVDPLFVVPDNNLVRSRPLRKLPYGRWSWVFYLSVTISICRYSNSMYFRIYESGIGRYWRQVWYLFMMSATWYQVLWIGPTAAARGWQLLVKHAVTEKAVVRVFMVHDLVAKLSAWSMEQSRRRRPLRTRQVLYHQVYIRYFCKCPGIRNFDILPIFWKGTLRCLNTWYLCLAILI